MAETESKSGFDFTKLNTLSLVSFALSIAWVGALAGVITGHVSLAQIKKSGERGRKLAIASLIIGYAYIGLSLLWGALMAGLAIRGIMLNHNGYGYPGGPRGMMNNFDNQGGWGMMGGLDDVQIPRGGGLVDPSIVPTPLPTAVNQ
ncbi:MAG: hypothetical protein RL556_91 [Actinomycetota bacterium]|jgi:hypothetical protein